MYNICVENITYIVFCQFHTIFISTKQFLKYITENYWPALEWSTILRLFKQNTDSSKPTTITINMLREKIDQFHLVVVCYIFPSLWTRYWRAGSDRLRKGPPRPLQNICEPQGPMQSAEKTNHTPQTLPLQLSWYCSS